MAGVLEVFFELDFVSSNSIVVTHNLGEEFLDVSVVINDEQSTNLITDVTTTSGNETNEFTVTLSSAQTGTVLVARKDFISVNTPNAKKSNSGAGGLVLTWGSDDDVEQNDWFQIGEDSNSTTAHSLPISTKITGISVSYSKVTNSGNILLYIDSTSQTLINIPYDNNVGTAFLSGLSIPVSAGARIRLRADSTLKLKHPIVNIIFEEI